MTLADTRRRKGSRASRHAAANSRGGGLKVHLRSLFGQSRIRAQDVRDHGTVPAIDGGMVKKTSGDHTSTAQDTCGESQPAEVSRGELTHSSIAENCDRDETHTTEAGSADGEEKDDSPVVCTPNVPAPRKKGKSLTPGLVDTLRNLFGRQWVAFEKDTARVQAFVDDAILHRGVGIKKARGRAAGTAK